MSMEIKIFQNYEVSSFGFYRKKGDIEWLPKKTQSPYISIGFAKDNEVKHISLHCLVAKLFIGDIPKGMEVNHKDHNKHNNAVSNLEIVTVQRNRKDRDHSFMKTINHKKEVVKTTDKTGKIVYYQSKSLAGKVFNTCPANVYLACKGSYKNNIYEGIKYELSKDTNPVVIVNIKGETADERKITNKKKAIENTIKHLEKKKLNSV